MADLAQRLKPQEWLQLWAPSRIAIVDRCRGLTAATLNGHQLRWARRLALLQADDPTTDLQSAEEQDKSLGELFPTRQKIPYETDDFWAEVLRWRPRESITTCEADAREFIADKYRRWAMEKGLPGLSNYAVRTWQSNKSERAGAWFSFEVMTRRTEGTTGLTSSEPELITPADLAGLQLDESWTRLLGSIATFCDVTVRTVPRDQVFAAGDAIQASVSAPDSSDDVDLSDQSKERFASKLQEYIAWSVAFQAEHGVYPPHDTDKAGREGWQRWATKNGVPRNIVKEWREQARFGTKRGRRKIIRQNKSTQQ